MHTPGRLLLLLLACAAMAQQQAPDARLRDPSKLELVLRVPGMERVEVRRGITYKTADSLPLKFDLYRPARVKKGERLPAVVFISGASNAKEWGIYTGYGRLAAAYGFTGVSYDKRYPFRFEGLESGAADTRALLEYLHRHAAELRIDPGRICVWAFSAGGALFADLLSDDAPSLRCLVSYYAIADMLPSFADAPAQTKEAVKRFSSVYALEERKTPLPPLMVVRAGLDNPQLNAGLDRFVETTVHKNLHLEFINYPEGHHGFDALDDNEHSREIMRRTLEFIRIKTAEP